MKRIQVLLFSTNYSIQHYSFIYPPSSGTKYCYIVSIIQFRHTDKKFQVLLFNTNNSIQNYSFVSALLDGSKYSYVSLTIQIDISHLFTHS